MNVVKCSSDHKKSLSIFKQLKIQDSWIQNLKFDLINKTFWTQRERYKSFENRYNYLTSSEVYTWVSESYAPYLVRFGKVVLSKGNEESSVKCQWKAFILFISIRSKLSIKTFIDRKCLDESNITLLKENLGLSSTSVSFIWYWKKEQIYIFSIFGIK